MRPRHDPFVRPAKLADARRKKSTAPSLAPIDLQLHGVLNAGSNSMINIDGSIAGYRLIAVLERAAMLEKNGERLLLQMDRENAHN